MITGSLNHLFTLLTLNNVFWDVTPVDVQGRFREMYFRIEDVLSQSMNQAGS
jgi:hypothetical protein